MIEIKNKLKIICKIISENIISYNITYIISYNIIKKCYQIHPNRRYLSDKVSEKRLSYIESKFNLLTIELTITF